MLRPAFTTSTPSAVAKWLLPVPGGPRKWITSLCPMKSSCARARMRFLSSEGWNEKSKPVRVLTVESLAILSAIFTRRFSRKLSSSANRVSITSTGFAPLELAHGLIKDFQGSRHLQTDQRSADAVENRGDDLQGRRHG